MFDTTSKHRPTDKRQAIEVHTGLTAPTVSSLTLRHLSAILPPDQAWGLWLSRQIIARVMGHFGPPLTGHNSLLVYVEGQLDYAVRGITTLLRQNLRYLDVRADVQRRYNEHLQRRLGRTTWMSGCRSWYLTADGFNASMYPGFATQYLRQMRDFRFGDYHAVAHEAPSGIGARIQT